jgi:uncharacterized membrane protein YkgB
MKTKLMTDRDARDVLGLAIVAVGIGVLCGGLIAAAGVPGAFIALGAILLVLGLAIGPPPDSDWPFKS